jgi:ribonuclease R
MTYPDVRAILEDHDQALMDRYSRFVPMFREMHELSLLIRVRRMRRGAIDFDFPEARVKLDEEGIPTEIIAEEADCATRIIEDFMLTANETVAEHFNSAEIPFVYRVHGDPDPEKIENVLAFVRKQGVSIQKTKQKITPKEIQNTLNAIKGQPSEPMISRIILRSMQQARYSTSCDGHFGLAAQYYCHFTSPIRRYPDLQIHRIIHDCIRGRMTEDRKRHYKDILDEAAEQSSVTERRAAEVERETVKLKKAQYMLMHIGESFEGIISSVTSWGIYVELPNTVEGLVRASDMDDDYYIFDDNKQAMVGRLSGKEYRLGDTVRVIMMDADLTLRTISFGMDPRPDNYG